MSDKGLKENRPLCSAIVATEEVARYILYGNLVVSNHGQISSRYSNMWQFRGFQEGLCRAVGLKLKREMVLFVCI